jgi:hypothetical protein
MRWYMGGAESTALWPLQNAKIRVEEPVEMTPGLTVVKELLGNTQRPQVSAGHGHLQTIHKTSPSFKKMNFYVILIFGTWNLVLEEQSKGT